MIEGTRVSTSWARGSSLWESRRHSYELQKSWGKHNTILDYWRIISHSLSVSHPASRFTEDTLLYVNIYQWSRDPEHDQLGIDRCLSLSRSRPQLLWARPSIRTHHISMWSRWSFTTSCGLKVKQLPPWLDYQLHRSWIKRNPVLRRSDLEAGLGENPAVTYRWSGWVWELTDCSSKLQGRNTDHFRGIHKIYTSHEWQQNRKMSTCNRLDSESLGSWPPTMPKNLPGHCLKVYNLRSFGNTGICLIRWVAWFSSSSSSDPPRCCTLSLRACLQYNPRLPIFQWTSSTLVSDLVTAGFWDPIRRFPSTSCGWSRADDES